MSEKRKHGTAFWVAVVVVSLVLYVLSIGPINWVVGQARAAGLVTQHQVEVISGFVGPVYYPLTWSIANAPEPVQNACFWYLSHFYVAEP